MALSLTLLILVVALSASCLILLSLVSAIIFTFSTKVSVMRVKVTFKSSASTATLFATLLSDTIVVPRFSLVSLSSMEVCLRISAMLRLFSSSVILLILAAIWSIFSVMDSALSLISSIIEEPVLMKLFGLSRADSFVPGEISTAFTPVMPTKIRVAVASSLIGVPLSILMVRITLFTSLGSILMASTRPTLMPRKFTAPPTCKPCTE